MCIKKFDEMQKAETFESIDFYYTNDIEESNDFEYYGLPKILFCSNDYKYMSILAKILYMMMLDKTKTSIDKGLVDSDYKVYIHYQKEKAIKSLKCSSSEVDALYKELKENRLITIKKQGLNETDLIYVKNIV